jgi:hypothetical protein
MSSQSMHRRSFHSAQATHRGVRKVLVQPLKCFRQVSFWQVWMSWMEFGRMLRDRKLPVCM